MLSAVEAALLLISPLLLMAGMVGAFERRDGKSRFVIYDGRTRRRSTLERKRSAWRDS